MRVTVTTDTDTITYAYDPGRATVLAQDDSITNAVLAYYEGLKATGEILAYEVD